MQYFGAKNIFNGEQWLEDHVVGLEEGLIQEVSPYDAAVHTNVRKVSGRLVPGFIDGQVYGAGGKLFSVYPAKETLQLMHTLFLAEGTIAFQPTVATNTFEVFQRCIDAVHRYWEECGQGVTGLHLEGPWLHPARRGAHIEALIHPPALSEVEHLLQYGKGVITTITLAPEQCSAEVINRILEEGIIIAAGHSNATYNEAMAAFDRGITTVTHLFNAMSPLHHREPGLVGAVLQHPSVRASIIPDGHHVHFAAIAIAKKIMGRRLYAITDAVTETVEGPYRHHLAGDKYESSGILSGSAISMVQAYRNLIGKAGIDREEALRMCSLYVAEALGCAGRYGKIAPGYAGPLLLLDENGNLLELIGQP